MGIGTKALISSILFASLPMSESQARSRGRRAAPRSIVEVPDNWGPSGIANRGSTLFVGSFLSGDIYRVDARTGRGAVLFDAPEGRVTLGMEYERAHDRLWALDALGAGLSLHDPDSGTQLQYVALEGPGPVAANDLVVTDEAAYISNTFGNGYFRIPLDRDGALGEPVYIEMSGDWEPATETTTEGLPPFGPNGIEMSIDGSVLYIVNSTTGKLYAVEPSTGVATQLDLPPFVAGDGLFRRRNKLYLTVNTNEIVVLRLSATQTSVTYEKTITNPVFNKPTNSLMWGSRIYTVNIEGETYAQGLTRYHIAVTTPWR